LEDKVTRTINMCPTKYILMDGVNAIQLGRKNLGWKVAKTYRYQANL